MSLATQWVDKVDNVDAVKAADVNMIAGAVKTLEITGNVAPKIGSNGTWLIWSPATSTFVDTGISATGAKGDAGIDGHGLVVADVYANYAAIVAAFPTGNDNIYQAADSHYLYIWSETRSQWYSLGAITPTSSAATTTYDHSTSSLAANNVQEAVDELADTISNGATVTPTVTLGMNNVIRNTANIEAFAKFTRQGKSYVNLLGKDGNCEDISKWVANGGTNTLDANNKMYGANGQKITLSVSSEVICYYPLENDLFGRVVPTKYYMLTAWVKNGNLSGAGNRIFIGSNGAGKTIKYSAYTTAATWNRHLVRLAPSDWGSSPTLLSCEVHGVGLTGEYYYTDGIMLNEITADEYANLTDMQLLEKYPYVDSYACLQNPYIEVRHDNLVRNGNGEEGIGYILPVGMLNNPRFENGYFAVEDTDSTTYRSAFGWAFNVKPSTTYTVRYIGKRGTGTAFAHVVQDITTGIAVIVSPTTDTSTTDTVKTFSFTTPSTCTKVRVALAQGLLATDTGIVYFKELSCIEGTTAPTEYKPCRIERCVIEGKFTSDDSFTYENGEVSGLLNWKHKTLFGKDYAWELSTSEAGYKKIRIPTPFIGEIAGNHCIKYDGKILKEENSLSVIDTFINSIGWGMYVTASNVDAGWTETIAPNADEVKAFMNGWKATGNNGTRCTFFASVLNGNVPVACALATASATTNTTAITVSSGGTNFVSGDALVICGSTGTPKYEATVTGTPTATNIPITPTQSVVTGDIIFKCDNGTTNISLLTWCKNNIAPNYEGYQLHYKLENPEPITDVNTHIHGDIPKFDVGDNYLYLDSGYVLGEVANVVSDATYAVINEGISTFKASALKNKAETIHSIYKNSIQDTASWTIDNGTNSYGNQRAYLELSNGKYATNATYTVDYQILKTMHTTPTAIIVSYQTDILNAIEDLAELVENKQNHDSALDTLVDLSMYEEIGIVANRLVTWVHFNSIIQLEVVIPYKALKRTTPIITLSNLTFTCGTGTSVLDIAIKVGAVLVYANKDHCILRCQISDSTTITNIKSYGAYIAGSVRVDCRGRI